MEPIVYNCICHGVAADVFKKTIAAKGIKSVEELHRFIPFGETCGMCIDPMAEYIKWYNNKNI